MRAPSLRDVAFVLSFVFICLAAGLGRGALADAKGADIAALSLKLFTTHGSERQDAIDALMATKDTSLIPTFVLASRWTGEERQITEALSVLTGKNIKTWHDAMRWQEVRPDLVPHASYRAIKLRFFGNTDRRFLRFFNGPGTTRKEMKIRFEEITWGGVLMDGIPPLDTPNQVLSGSAEAAYLRDEDLVFGISINGDVRAYPLRIMGWHEMVNDVIGGVPVTLAYCTLCGAGILFETKVEGHDEALTFGSSGFLYRSNKLMFDRKTHSLWNQFTGKPVSGPLVKQSITLKQLPILITSWKGWRSEHPLTKVLSMETGYTRDYGSGVAYHDYFASPDLMFPARVQNTGYAKKKDYVFGVRQFGASKAWPLNAFKDNPVINDTIGQTNIVLIGNSDTRSVRAYERKNEMFKVGGAGPNSLLSGSATWAVTEQALISPGRRSLPRVAGHIAYWFAWDNYLGPQTELYEVPVEGAPVGN